jgi:hypothetical protein
VNEEEPNVVKLDETISHMIPPVPVTNPPVAKPISTNETDAIETVPSLESTMKLKAANGAVSDVTPRTFKY